MVNFPYPYTQFSILLRKEEGVSHFNPYIESFIGRIRGKLTISQILVPFTLVSGYSSLNALYKRK